MVSRDPSDIYPSNWLDLMHAAAWAPPNFPPFQPLAPAPTDAKLAVSAPAIGTPPWLQPLYEVQRAADTLSPSRPDPTSHDDMTASPGMSNRSSAPSARAAASPHTGAVAANPYLGSSYAGDLLDPARTQHPLERAKRDYDFVRWLSGVSPVRPAQPLQYVAAAAGAPRADDGIDDAVNQPAPFNRPPAFSPPQLPLRKAQGTYWSLLSPSGALLPITKPSYQPPRAMADIQPAPAPALPPDVPLTGNNVARSISTGVPIAGGVANKANAALPFPPDPQSSGGILGALLASRNAPNSGGGILQGLVPDPREYAEPAAAGGVLGSLLANTSLSVPNAAPGAAAPPFLVGWMSSGPSIRPTQPMQYVAAAADGPRPRTPTAGIYDAVDQPAPVNRPPAFPLPAREAEVAPPEGSYLSTVSPEGAIRAPRMIDVTGGAGPANAPEGPDLVSLAQHGMLPRLVSPLPVPPAPAASPEDEPKLTNKATWNPRTWSAYDNPLAWLQLEYERKFPAEAARLKRMPMGGDVPAFDAPNAARRMGEAFASGYGDEPIISTRDPGSITRAGPATIPEWARPHFIASMRAGNSLPQALDQVLRAGRGAIAMVPAAGAGVAQDLDIVDEQGADKLQGELGIFMQFPGEPGVPSLAVAPRAVPRTVGQRVLRRAEERPLLPVELPEPNVGPSHMADFRARHNVPTTDTIAVGRTNAPGLEDFPFEGASPAVWQEAGLPPKIPGQIESPSQIPRDRRHAEGDLFNQFIRKVQERRLRPSDVEGKLVIHVSNPNGVCSVCRWGLDNPNVRAGVIKQFSKLYPKLTIEFSVATQPGIKTVGPSRFTIRDGAYVKRSDR